MIFKYIILDLREQSDPVHVNYLKNQHYL